MENSKKEDDGLLIVKDRDIPSRELRLQCTLYTAWRYGQDGGYKGLMPILSLVEKITDNQGTLSVYWNTPSIPVYYKDAFQLAWESVGEQNVEHELIASPLF